MCVREAERETCPTGAGDLPLHQSLILGPEGVLGLKNPQKEGLLHKLTQGRVREQLPFLIAEREKYHLTVCSCLHPPPFPP